jgi:hypothetical protein
MTLTLTFDLALLYLVAANVIAILVYVLLLKQRARRLARNITAITTLISDYFRADGVEVGVNCVTNPGGKGFIAFIESEPMKRFRYSHVIEASLRSHVKRMCGEELERIFWRFPIPRKDHAAEEAAGEKEGTDTRQDEYFREGLEYLKKRGVYDIREGSWEEFENTVMKTRAKPKP